MRPRQKCELCGKDVIPDIAKYRKARGWSMLCKECHTSEVTARREHKEIENRRHRQELLKSKRCVVCGGEIPWKELYMKKSVKYWPSTCSTRCHGIQSKKESTYTKEFIEDKIKELILRNNRWTQYSEVIKTLRVASKVLIKHKISVNALNKEVLGIQVNKYTKEPAIIKAPTLHDLIEYSGIPCKTHSELLTGLRKAGQDTKEIVRDIFLSYIADRGIYTGVTAFMSAFSVSFEYIRRKHCLDIKELNRTLGFTDKKASWYESTAADMLIAHFGAANVSREHVFTDCRSGKGYPLRFDFYIPKSRVLIEVDGEQHVNPDNGFYTASLSRNDRIKEQYAASNGLSLRRILTTPRHTFVSRFKALILDVVKPVELLETRPDNAEGNQQPACERRITTGSETIEKQSDD